MTPVVVGVAEADPTLELMWVGVHCWEGAAEGGEVVVCWAKVEKAAAPMGEHINTSLFNSI